MKFDKSILSEIEYITLVLENCDEFSIKSKDIIDFWTSEVKKNRGGYSDNSVDDGGMIISKNAFQDLSDYSKDVYADGTNDLYCDLIEHFDFYSRIINCCDICQVHLKYKSRKKYFFFVPYNPLEESLYGGEIELSNCPSAEINENGDLLILFGKSSRSYKRIDNNYSDLIIGFKEEVNWQLEEPLEIKLEELSNVDCDDCCPKIIVDMRITNKECTHKRLCLVFEDVSHFNYDIFFDINDKRELYMSRISTGEIFVDIKYVCNFYCRAVKTNSVYCGIDGDFSKYTRKEAYRRFLNCELSENEMKLLPSDYFWRGKKEINFKHFAKCKQKVLSGDISVKYFMYWLHTYSVTIGVYRDAQLQKNEQVNRIAVLMDRLQIRLSYFEKVEDCRELIDDFSQEIEKCYKKI